MSQEAVSAERDGYKTVQLGPKTVEIPEEWTTTQIQEIADVEYGKSLPEEDGTVPAVGSSGIFDYVGDSLVQNDTLVVGRKGSAGETYLLKEPSWPSDTTFYLDDFDNEILDIEFLYSFMCRFSLAEELERTTLPSLDRSRLETYRILTPPLPEQRRIAEILSTVDEQIQETEEIIETTKELKRGLMQNLFSPDSDKLKSSKLGEIPNDWEVTKIKDVGEDLISGGTPDTENENYYDGDIPWITTSELDDKIITSSNQSITEKGLSESSAKIVPDGAVLIAMYGATAGKTGLLSIEAATNQACCAILTDSSMDNRFLYQYLQFERDRMMTYTAGSGQQNLRKSIVELFDIKVPPLEEQERISNILTEFDNKVREEQQKKQDLQELKRGLMQDLLTGTVRVDGLDACSE